MVDLACQQPIINENSSTQVRFELGSRLSEMCLFQFYHLIMLCQAQGEVCDDSFHSQRESLCCEYAAKLQGEQVPTSWVGDKKTHDCREIMNLHIPISDTNHKSQITINNQSELGEAQDNTVMDHH